MHYCTWKIIFINSFLYHILARFSLIKSVGQNGEEEQNHKITLGEEGYSATSDYKK